MITDTTKGTRPALGTVRVTLPANVAFNPDLLKKSIVGLAEQLGCPKCFSGADCFFHLERDFVIDGGRVSARVATTTNFERLGRRGEVVVALGAGNQNDLERILGAVDKINDLLGCTPCHSGFDILYRNQAETIVFNAKMEPQRYGPTM
jgi:hypothetical protein